LQVLYTSLVDRTIFVLWRAIIFATPAGGMLWLVVSLTFCPDDDTLKWANKVVARHPNHQTIVLTHSYLTHKGRDLSGEDIWNNFVKSHANVLMVFCGHLSTAG
ncbi:MAG: hypothetical protein QGH94_11180, partial [Phycisphaerae bacterium]|nr:hypothetical protein [Phycisphaerae bacterium]